MRAFPVVRVAITVFVPCSVGWQTVGYWSVFTLRYVLWSPQVHQISLLGGRPGNVLTLPGLVPERLCSIMGSTLCQLGFNRTLFLFPLPKPPNA